MDDRSARARRRSQRCRRWSINAEESARLGNRMSALPVISMARATRLIANASKQCAIWSRA